MTALSHGDMSLEELAQEEKPKKPNKSKPSTLLRWVVGPLFLITAIALSALIYHAQNGGVVIRTVEYFRNCSIQFGDKEVTGTRSYMYQYKELFGWRLYSADNAIEKTTLSIQGEPLSVVGLNDEEESWSLHIKEGELYKQLIIPAERYVFMYGDDRKTVITTYNGICK